MKGLLVLTILFASLALQGCGTIDPELAPYIQKFYREAAARKMVPQKPLRWASFVDTFGSPEEDAKVAARCISFLNGVEVRRGAWDEGGESEKTNLIFHELGHCLLDRPHLDGGVQKFYAPTSRFGLPHVFSAPLSVMNAGWYVDEESEPFWNEYVDELFFKKPVSFKPGLSAQEVATIESRWLERFAPLASRFKQEAEKRGVSVPEISFQFDSHASPTTSGSVHAKSISNDLTYYLDESASEAAIEFVFFGALFSRLEVFRTTPFRVVEVAGKSMWSGFGNFNSVRTSPDFVSLYESHREAVLNGMFVSNPPVAVPALTEAPQ